MRITKKSGYGLIAMTELAIEFDESYVSTARLSDKYGLPQPFLEKIMRQLKDGGLVEVKRGRGGGYGLKKTPDHISVKDIISILEDNSCAPVSCLIPNGNGDCPIENGCPTVYTWKLIYNKIDEVLSSFTLEDVITNL